VLERTEIFIRVIPKGPYWDSDGRPLKLTVNSTPVPFELAVPIIDPWMVLPTYGSNCELGKVAI